MRCDDLAPGTAAPAVAGLSGATQAVAASDGMRVVGCYAEGAAAEADAAGLRAEGIEARVEPGGSQGKGSAAIQTVRAALDPEGVFV